jgi:large subunit ribosomal protein L24
MAGAKKAAPRKAPKMKIRKGDKVVVIAGKDINREGTVIAVNLDRQQVLVQGVNLIRKNTKVNYQGQRGAKEGGIVTQEALIHISNVALVDPDSKKATRAGYRTDAAENKKVRVARASGKDI